MDTRDADLGREALVRLVVKAHPLSKRGHGENVRSSYLHGQADCTVCGIDDLPLSEHAPAVSKIEQGQYLRAWREHIGAARGRKITLMELADKVADLAREKNIPSSSRKVPGTHASMTRWELGKVDQALLGLSLIAEVYGIATHDLMAPPPGQPTPPNEGGPTDEELGRAFREFLTARKPR